MTRVQVITGPERRRRWADEQKRAIVEASFAPGSVVAEIARRADVRPSQIYRWQQAEARASGAEAMVAHLKLLIAKMKRDRFGQSSERGRQVLDQLELQLEELEAGAAEDEAALPSTVVHGFARRRPVRAPLPAHLPRERVVVPAPTACPCCGGKLAKLGEDITETLEVVPRQWKVIQTVREKFTCRRCEAITQPPAPFHPIARARAGASLLAMILYAKFGEHQPLNRQSASYAREGVELDTSTLADWVGACSATLMPLVEMVRSHVFAAERVRSWPRVRPRQHDYGRMSETIGRSAGRIRPLRSSITRATAAVSIHAGIWPAMPESSRPTPMPGSASSTMPSEGRGRSPRRCAGAMAVAISSSSPTPAKRRWRSKPCGASTRSSRSSVNSTGSPLVTGALPARTASRHWSAILQTGCAPSGAGCRATPRPPRP